MIEDGWRSLEGAGCVVVGREEEEADAEGAFSEAFWEDDTIGAGCVGPMDDDAVFDVVGLTGEVIVNFVGEVIIPFAGDVIVDLVGDATLTLNFGITGASVPPDFDGEIGTRLAGVRFGSSRGRGLAMGGGLATRTLRAGVRFGSSRLTGAGRIKRMGVPGSR